MKNIKGFICVKNESATGEPLSDLWINVNHIVSISQEFIDVTEITLVDQTKIYACHPIQELGILISIAHK